MRKWIAIIIALMSVGCFASNEIDFRFDNYSFSIPGSPRSISTYEQVILAYDSNGKLFFYKNNYSDYDDYGIDLPEFFSAVFSGESDIKNPDLSKLSNSYKTGLKSRKKLNGDGFTAELLQYEGRQVIQIHESGNNDYWVSIESKNIDIASVFGSLKMVKRS